MQDNQIQEDLNSSNTMSWTPEELQKWWEAGLVPTELFEPSRYMELYEYLKKNKKILYEHYHRNFENDHYKIELSPPSEWHKTPDLYIIDKRTGNVVRTLEQIHNFELCEGVCLTVNAKELKEWEKETAETKNFDKEQHQILKAALERIGPEKPLTRKEIVALIEEIRKPIKPKKYRQSGHLVDQKLKYQISQNQPSLFDVLLPETKHKIEESKIEVKAEGIKLTPPENKLIHALNRLLHEKSHNNKHAEEEGFYEGNISSELVPYGTDLKSKAAVLKFKPSELYKSYIGHDEYSGHDIQFINNLLQQLESKKVLIKYDRIKKVLKGKKTETLTDRIEDFQSLIKIISFIPDLTEEEKAKLDRGDSSIRVIKGEIIIALNPIFTDQIDTKFIEFPMDTNRRLVIAAGGHNKVTASMMTLMEWMLRDLSAKRYKTEFNEENLPYILGLEKYIKQGRKKIISERIIKDIESIKNMGIILHYEKIPNSTGGFKWVFQLNKDYE